MPRYPLLAPEGHNIIVLDSEGNPKFFRRQSTFERPDITVDDRRAQVLPFEQFLHALRLKPNVVHVENHCVVRTGCHCCGSFEPRFCFPEGGFHQSGSQVNVQATLETVR